jgi:hypothetical protein
MIIFQSNLIKSKKVILNRHILCVESFGIYNRVRMYFYANDKILGVVHYNTKMFGW